MDLLLDDPYTLEFIIKYELNHSIKDWRMTCTTPTVYGNEFNTAA